MPLYEYSCDKCGEQFEEIRSASDSEEVVCPECGAAARKLMSLFSTGSAGGGGGCGHGAGGHSGGG